MMPRISLLFLVLCLTVIQAVFSFPIDAKLEEREITILNPISKKVDGELKADVTDPKQQLAIEEKCAKSTLCLFNWGGCMDICIPKQLATWRKQHKTSRGK
jgi:hypothetical protein